MNREIIVAAAAVVAVAIALLAGCETAPEGNSTLDEARAAVQAAESDASVAKHAQAEINRARSLLTNAEGAMQQRGVGDAVTAHYAYLATQMARIAEQRAHEQIAMARIKAGETERRQILSSARESEASQAQAQAESQRLAAQLADLQAAQTDRGIVLTLGDVLFDTGRSELKPGATRALDQIAAFLNEHPERRVQIEGFTDSQGSSNYNLELSQSRADAVAMAIIRRGVDAQRVRALGYGEEFPKTGNSSEGSRQMNRRVEIIVSNNDASIPGRIAGVP
jgi:outer membrane protein OmpA-like peptidoglycan-associated protein